MGVAILGVGGRVFRDDGEVAAGHGDLVVGGGFVAVAGVFVEELEEGFVGVVVEVVDLVAPREEVGDGTGRGLVDDRRGNDVDHVAVVMLDGDVEFGLGVEAAEGREVDVASEDCDAD